MIAFLLLNWRWLVPTAGAAILGIWLGFAKLEIADLKSTAAKTELRIEKQKTDAANRVAESLRRVAEIENQNAETSRQLETKHAEDLQTIENGRADFDARLDKRVRELAECRAGRGNSLPTKTTNTAESPKDADGGDAGLRNIDPESARNLRSSVLKLRADFQECFGVVHAWGR